LKNCGFEEFSGECMVRKIYNDEDGMVNRVKVNSWLVLLVPVVLKDKLMVGLGVSWPGFAKNG
jgi:hypothetical protein